MQNLRCFQYPYNNCCNTLKIQLKSIMTVHLFHFIQCKPENQLNAYLYIITGTLFAAIKKTSIKLSMMRNSNG